MMGDNSSLCVPPVPPYNVHGIENHYIYQLDGNDSIDSFSTISEPVCSCCDMSDNANTTWDQDLDIENVSSIQVIETNNFDVPYCQSPPSWYEEYTPRVIDPRQSKANLKTIRRDNRLMMTESLPILSVSNLRSLWPKLNSFKEDMKMRDISCAMLSEVWEKANCKKQQFELEKMLNMDGMKYISTPRTTKRGGGAAIVAQLNTFTLDKIEVPNPNKVEVVFGLLRPKKTTCKIKEIIIAAFYSPPKSRKNPQLLDHLLSNSLNLLSKYPNAGLCIGGDRNNLNISPLLNGIPKLSQLVTKPTYQHKVLDIILTNMSNLYCVPIITPPVQPDNPQYGSPSDHSTPVAIPLATDTVQQTREYVVKVTRPLPESGILEFGEWLCKEDWKELSDTIDPTEQALIFEKNMQLKLDLIFPTKSLKINPNKDLPFITADLKKMDRLIKREYRKNSKSIKYQRLKSKYDKKFKIAASDYLDKSVRTLMEDDPGTAYRCLKRLAAQPGDHTDEGSFKLSSHQEANITPEESIDRIAEHFSIISQEFAPLNYHLLPPDVQAKVDLPISESDIPDLPDHDVYQKIKKSKKPKSSVPGDIPRKLVQEFGPELALPAGKIFRNIVKTGHWPKPWRVEYGTPLKKVSNPETEDQLRIISLTSFLSKVFEQYVVEWLMKYVGKKMDWGQYGGEKGSSISHYLIEFVNYILYNQDMNIPHAVLAVMIDYSKAFNRICHNNIIRILSNMGVPGWLLRIVMGFLTERELIVRHEGKQSGRKWLPGGSPQGTRLGFFLFLILINAAGYEQLEKQLGEHITKKKNRRQIIPNIHMKYVDDLTLAETINVKDSVLPNPDPNPPRPLAYRDRTLHMLPRDQTPVQAELYKMVQYCEENQMRINTDKTKAVLFNTARKYDFMPQLTIDGTNPLEVVEEFRLLGLVFKSNLSWQANTNQMCQKGFARLWMLRRLKKLGATQSEMIDVYYKQIRCILELAVAVWTPGLNKGESDQIERVQKCALHVIMGDNYQNYDHAAQLLEVDKLSQRRVQLCLNFARRLENHPKYSTWFHPAEEVQPPYIKTRSEKTLVQSKYTPVPYRTDRFSRSPLPYLTELLNTHHARRK